MCLISAFIGIRKEGTLVFAEYLQKASTISLLQQGCGLNLYLDIINLDIELIASYYINKGKTYPTGEKKKNKHSCI